MSADYALYTAFLSDVIDRVQRLDLGLSFFF